MAHASARSGVAAIGHLTAGRLTASRLTALGLLLAALTAALFHWFLFRRDNAAPVVNIQGYVVGAPADVVYAIDGCWVTPRKVAVRGWIARKGVTMGRRSLRVVAVDEASGEMRGLQTVLQSRPDIDETLAHRFGGNDHYVQPGFSASLNLAVADRSLRGRALYAAYDDGHAKVLIPLECRIGDAP